MDQARMRVSDRGRGFRIESIQNGRGLGLIRHARAAAASALGQGTDIEVAISCRMPEKATAARSSRI